VGVEPTAGLLGPPLVLKTRRATGPNPPPCVCGAEPGQGSLRPDGTATRNASAAGCGVWGRGDCRGGQGRRRVERRPPSFGLVKGMESREVEFAQDLSHRVHGVVAAYGLLQGDGQEKGLVR